MLTEKQHRLLIYINEAIKEHGVCPSFEEMKNHLNLHSKSGIHRIISALEQRKFIRRSPNKARAIEVLMLPAEKYVAPVKVMNKRVTKGFSQSVYNVVNDNSIEIPLFGKIAAGVPIEAIRNPSDMVTIPSTMVGSGEHYALKIEGDSMKNIGIMDGDTVIIKRADYAPNGAIVVALVDGFEATLKRIQISGRQVSLIPENPDYETRILDIGRVEVQGLLVGLMRSYH
ncbi:MAG: transcriptional repressor LexA [Alphaproteobacteria bacterium]|nr:transcriptional repressor LexA [Alphaproteobacteria bacterium]